MADEEEERLRRETEEKRREEKLRAAEEYNRRKVEDMAIRDYEEEKAEKMMTEEQRKASEERRASEERIEESESLRQTKQKSKRKQLAKAAAGAGRLASSAAGGAAAGARGFRGFMRGQHEATKGSGTALLLFGLLFYFLDWLMFGFNNSPGRVIFYCAASIIFYIYLYSGQREFLDVLGLICIFLTVFFLLPGNAATFGLAAAFFAAAIFIFIKGGLPQDVIVIAVLFILSTALPTLIHFYPRLAEIPIISLIFISILWPWFAIYGLFRMESNLGNILKVLFIIYLVVFFVGGVAFKNFYHQKFVTPQQEKAMGKGFANVREAASTTWKWVKAGFLFIRGNPTEWEKLQNETKKPQKGLEGIEEKTEPIIIDVERDPTSITQFEETRADIKAMTELNIKGPVREVVIVDVSCYIEDIKNKKNITAEVNLAHVTKEHGEPQKTAKLICRPTEALKKGTYRFVFKITREDIESQVKLIGLYYYSQSQFNIEETSEARTIVSKTYPEGIVSKAFPPNEQAVGIIEASISQQSPVTRIEQGTEIPLTLGIKNIGTGAIKNVNYVNLKLPEGMGKAAKFCEAFEGSGEKLEIKQEVLKKINYGKAETGRSVTFASCNVRVGNVNMPPNKIDRKIFAAEMRFIYVLEEKVAIEVI